MYQKHFFTTEQFAVECRKIKTNEPNKNSEQMHLASTKHMQGKQVCRSKSQLVLALLLIGW